MFLTWYSLVLWYYHVKMAFVCSICKVSFSKRYTLKKHLINVHSVVDKVSELLNYKTYKCAEVCDECNKKFVNKSTLTKHVKKYHPDMIDKLIKRKKYAYECEECKKHFTHEKNFKMHKKIHNPDAVVRRATLKCCLCDYKDTSTVQLINHFKNVHDVAVISESLEFSDVESFTFWKTEMENETNSSFISQHGSYSTTNSKKVKYICHRSGHYKKNGSGSRHIKARGTSKINGFCPAQLKVETFNNGKCVVEYVKTHLGHDCYDLGYLRLPRVEREALATKIATKIPFQSILDEIQDSITASKLERKHLLTRKDLFNIQQCFNLNNKDTKHAVSVDCWVEQVQSTGCILFYKPKDVISKYSQLKQEDFVLIIMNQDQAEMLKRYGSDCVCVDGTYGLNLYEFEVSTLLVLDDKEGFPCSFLISNRADEEIMTIFFSCIEEKLGVKLQPKVFMSDVAPVFYNAWINVMKPPEFRLFCTWHVDRAWRKNLNKISSKEKQVLAYNQLRKLLQERDLNAFTHMLDSFIKMILGDADTFEFGKYFSETYANNAESWAYYYRLSNSLNTNMHIERIHEVIKYIYFDGKALHTLMKFVRDKFCQRLVDLYEEQTFTKSKELKCLHETSVSLDLVSVVHTGSSWDVSSTSSQEIYKVEGNNAQCKCKLLCTECETCLHHYSCTCTDYTIKWNMCKHIHLVCRYLKESGFTGKQKYESGGEDQDTLLNDDFEIENDEAQLMEAISKSKNESEDDFLTAKEKFKQQVSNIIDSITTQEELDAIKKLADPFRQTLNDIRFQHQIDFQENKCVAPQNINIVEKIGKYAEVNKREAQ